MQQRVNDKTDKVTQKERFQPSVKTPDKAGVATPTRDYNPLEDIACKIGDNTCAAKHVSVIQQTGLFRPMNESQKVQSLLSLQRQYGNRFVQRVIAQTKKGGL